MIQTEPTAFPPAALLTLPAFPDDRGLFVKTFQKSVWRESGIDFELKESYFSVSGKGVIRGMHFQLPPHSHSKLVFCPKGAIRDVIVDIRRESPTYGQLGSYELSAANHRALYIPEGFAHGFESLEADSITYYLVSSEYSKDHDTGIRYDSIGMDWHAANPVISARDLSFPSLQEFNSPF